MMIHVDANAVITLSTGKMTTGKMKTFSGFKRLKPENVSRSFFPVVS